MRFCLTCQKWHTELHFTKEVLHIARPVDPAKQLDPKKKKRLDEKADKLRRRHTAMRGLHSDLKKKRARNIARREKRHAQQE